jgi:hypothetical protein
MAYQFKREPLTPVEADKIYQSCNTVQEKLITHLTHQLLICINFAIPALLPDLL